MDPISIIYEGWKVQTSEISKQGQKYVTLPFDLGALGIVAKATANIALRIICSVIATLMLSIGTIFCLTYSLLNTCIVALSPLNDASKRTKAVATVLLLPLLIPAGVNLAVGGTLVVSGNRIFNDLKPSIPPSPQVAFRDSRVHTPSA